MLLAAWISLSSFVLHLGHSNILSFNSNSTFDPQCLQYLVVGNHLSNIIIKPTYSLGQTINRMKQMTTNYLYRNERSRLWLRKFYWAKRLTVWTHGYFASTIGQVSELTQR